MTTLKKPVKPTKEIIDKAVARRKTVLRTERKALKSGTLAQINEQLINFASDNRVSTEAVRFTFTYYGANMTCRRQETQDEKYARTKDDYEYKYRVAKRNYDSQMRYAEQERERAEATLRRLNATPVVNKTVVCCQCSCRCKS